ncbi:unnamed protein product, partial [Mesorhabditis belari]|uniref:Uncharacterized protein n=1 Tax=Mesorhabditis belari TaxID=2138241 RepID=A0AAF3EG46_9BILA
MSHQIAPGQTMAEIYRGVINDVIAQMKETFLDENVDIDVLQQMKKDWEDRVRQSHAVDLDGPKVPAQQNLPPLRANQRQVTQAMPQPQATRAQQQPATQQYQSPPKPTPIAPVNYANRPVAVVNMPHQQLLGHQMEQPQARVQQQPQTQQPAAMYMQQAQQQQNQLHHFQGLPNNVVQIQALQAQAQAQANQLRMLPNNAQPQQQFLMHNAQGIPQPVMILGGQGQQFLANTNFVGQVGQRIVLQPQQQTQGQQQQQLGHDQQHHIRQIDGQNFIEEEIIEDMPGTSHSNTQTVPPRLILRNLKDLQKPKRVKGKELNELLKRLGGVVQVDGNGGMTDSSSEDEEVEEEDPLQNIVNRIDDKGEGDDEEQTTDEAPLNSGDDQSDEEDVETLFAAENIVVCQFEKVGRTRQKWKFNLKDGIMHIAGRDYCFQKCTGEAEW